MIYGGAPTTAFIDQKANGLRVCLLSQYHTTSISNSPSASPVTSEAYSSPEPIVSPSGKVSSSTTRSSDKKPKVKRPPNAFILYRKFHHQKLVAANPNMKNNDISVILGRQWRHETEEVRAVWNVMADKIKRKHAKENPGYQYAPRKPSEKKRRMTQRKLAAQREAEQQPDIFSATEMVEVADHDRSTSDEEDVYKRIASIDAASWIGMSEQEPGADLFRVDEDTQDVSVTLPAPQQALHQQIDTHYDGVDGLLPFDPRFFSTDSAPQVTNEIDFVSSLIDWEGIDADMEILRQSTSEERGELPAVETGGSQPLAWNQQSAEEFQRDLDRLMKLV